MVLSYIPHFEFPIFDIYFSNLRGTYIEQAISGELEKKKSDKWNLNSRHQISIIRYGSFRDTGLSYKY